MKGKKLDTEFVSNYISNCISQGIVSSDEIAATAQFHIDDIDEQIKRLEKSKLERSKLLDVLETFNKGKIKPNEASILPLFKIKFPNICKYICDNVKIKVYDIRKIHEFNELDFKFCVKQMVENKILVKSGDYLSKGELFEQYCKFVMKV